MSWSRPWTPPAEPSPPGGAPCPSCAACGSSCTATSSGRPAATSTSPSRSTIDGRRRAATASPCCPAKLVVRHRPGPRRPARSSVEIDGDEARIAVGSLAVRRAHHPRRRVPAAARAGRRAPSPSTAEAFAEALRQVVAAASDRRVPPDPHRRAAGRRGRRPAPGGHRLVPPGRPRPARHLGAGARARACWCRPRALKELARLLSATPRRSPCASASATSSFEVGDVRLTTRLIEGEFPNYRGLIPSAPAQPAHASAARPLLEAVRRVRLLAREATPGAPGHEAPTALELRRHHPGRRPGPRGARRQVRGRRAHRGVQPGVPDRRRRGHHRATRSPSRPSTR